MATAGLLGGPMLNLGRCRLGAASTETVSTRAVDVVGRSPVVDMLGLLTLDWARVYGWERSPESFEETDFWRLGRTGVDVLHPAVETPGRDRRRAALRWLELWRRLLSSRPCFLAPVETARNLHGVPGSGKIGVIVGFQNSDHFDSPADVETFHRLGQRVSQLTYNRSNRLGSGCRSSRDRGLTRFGGQVVAEMNRVGMAIDLSHCGEQTTLDAIRLSTQPVLITHSNCRALVPGQPRCKSDRVIRELARHGGVMGITVVRAFVGRGSPTMGDVLAHFDHVARLVGIEHAGLGSDVDFTGTDPKSGRLLPYYRIGGLSLPLRVFQLADGLLARGYGADDVELVLGRNFQRALTNIWTDGTWPSAERPPRDPFCPAPIEPAPAAQRTPPA